MYNLGVIDRWIWETNRWDGPIEGVAIVNGKQRYLEMFTEDESRNRVFNVFNPPDWWWKIIKVDKKLFEYYVGTHTSYDKNGFRDLDGVKPMDSWRYYYDYLKTNLNVKDEWKVGACFEFEPNY